jgi:hypothetical protein
MPQFDPAMLLALMPAILGLVNFLKAFGLEGKPLTAASMVIGVAFALAYQLLPAGVFQVAYNGLIVGLAACGLYDIANMVAKKAQQ